MPAYLITEHHGRRIKPKSIMLSNDPSGALAAFCTIPSTVTSMPPDAGRWRFIDDGLGGGALIDPRDDDHCLRADPRKVAVDGTNE